MALGNVAKALTMLSGATVDDALGRARIALERRTSAGDAFASDQVVSLQTERLSNVLVGLGATIADLAGSASNQQASSDRLVSVLSAGIEALLATSQPASWPD